MSPGDKKGKIMGKTNRNLNHRQRQQQKQKQRARKSKSQFQTVIVQSRKVKGND